MITKQKFEDFLERHNLTIDVFCYVTDISKVTLEAYIEGTLQNRKSIKRIDRSIYVIRRNQICMPVLDGYYRLLTDVMRKRSEVKQLEKNHREQFKDIFNQCYEDEFGE